MQHAETVIQKLEEQRLQQSLSFTGTVLDSCAGFMTIAVLSGYGCATGICSILSPCLHLSQFVFLSLLELSMKTRVASSSQRSACLLSARMQDVLYQVQQFLTLLTSCQLLPKGYTILIRF